MAVWNILFSFFKTDCFRRWLYCLCNVYVRWETSHFATREHIVWPFKDEVKAPVCFSCLSFGFGLLKPSLLNWFPLCSLHQTKLDFGSPKPPRREVLEEEASIDFVFIPPETKERVLTEHQKEVKRTKRSDLSVHLFAKINFIKKSMLLV